MLANNYGLFETSFQNLRRLLLAPKHEIILNDGRFYEHLELLQCLRLFTACRTSKVFYIFQLEEQAMHDISEEMDDIRAACA